jgi:alkylation response protein AidB-like acyl-CoA dehydrogenase
MDDATEWSGRPVVLPVGRPMTIESLSVESGLDQGELSDPLVFRLAFRQWLVDQRPSLPKPAVGGQFGQRLLRVRELQARLYEAGWARCGWPESLGGLGGSPVHRAVLYDELALAGHPTRIAFEHIEILAPAMMAHWNHRRFATMLQRLLSGEELWCQGFSEPDAGSDLASLRTRATRDGDGYRISGTKCWTSWAVFADRCVVLARTGTLEERHRGLTAFFVDLGSEGVTVRPIRQANGTDELAEVTFDSVWVTEEDRVGGEGEGWRFALDVLSCERSAFAWLRQTRLMTVADRLAAMATAEAAAVMGDIELDLFALRATSAQAVRELANGRFMGPAAAPSKSLLTSAEQNLYDAAQLVLGPDLALGTGLEDVSAWQEDYLFSRVVSIYGGTRQIQYMTIARFLLGLPHD